MVKKHLKRFEAPSTWGLGSKDITFVTKPFPSGHPLELSMPLNVIMRDRLGIVETNKQAKYIVKNKKVNVNGKAVKDIRNSVGLFDVLGIEESYYRMILNKKGVLDMIDIKKKDANTKLCKITGISQVKGDIQLNLNDGKNIFVEKKEYNTNDTIVLNIDKNAIEKHLEFKKGNLIFLIKGNHIGSSGELVDVKGNKIIFKDKDGKKRETPKDYAFIVGKKKPAIEIEENE